MKPSKLSMILAKNIRNKRLEQQISQEKLSEELDVHRNTIAFLETGIRWVGPEMLQKLADFFHCQPYELLKENSTQ